MHQQDQFDSELQTYFAEIKTQLKAQHNGYIRSHPQLRQILNDFLSSLLLQRPDDVYEYAKNYFAYFNMEKDVVKQKPLVIVGPSGVGKGTLIKWLLSKYPQLFELSISYTTRAPRPGQVHGRQYYFISKDEFKKEIVKDAFAEYFEVHGNYYGTHKGKLNSIINKGKICVLEIDIKGSEKIYSSSFDCNYIFIDTSIDKLEDRLKNRGTETEEAILLQLQNSKVESQRAACLDYFIHLNNDDLDECKMNLLQKLMQLYPLIKQQ